MELVIVSHTPHYRRDGVIVGWGPTVREIDQLATLFDRVVHVAPLYSEAPPASAIPYASQHIVLRPVTPAGGLSVWSKLGVIARIPEYAAAIRESLRQADVVHVRCPANISLIAVLLLTLGDAPKTRWIKYAGNWVAAPGEAISYRLQRWLLRMKWHGSQVTVNGVWGGQSPHVHSFLNPCLTEKELEGARHAAQEKRLTLPVRLIYAGRLERAKGVRRLLEVLIELVIRGVPVMLDLIGDGPDRRRFEEMVEGYGVSANVRFHGWLPRPELGPLYARAHMIVLPSSSSEGWPKVLSEAMAYGVVPVASNVSSIPQYLQRFGAGKTLDPEDVNGFVQAVCDYIVHPEEWREQSENAVRAAAAFSYAEYLLRVQSLLGLEEPGLPARPATREESAEIAKSKTEEHQTSSCS